MKPRDGLARSRATDLRVLVLAPLLLAGCGAKQPALECPTGDPTQSSLEEKKVYSYYEVSAPTPQMFVKTAHEKRPFKSDLADAEGFTESQLCLQFTFQPEETQCRISAIRLTHNVRITLSRWVDVPAKHAEWYRKSSARLAVHEEGHYAIGDAVAHEYYAAASGVTTAPTCDELEKKLTALNQQFGDEARRRNAEFDKQDYAKTGVQEMGEP